ncbi:MAG: 2'-5' RNA ligase family protein [Eubacteriales bacterium]|nr:2'-5' RNA ligase family protein [Eubacteriales bacterium]
MNDIYEQFGFKPHITLTEFSTDNFSAVCDLINSLANRLDSVDVRFSSLGIFPGQQGVFHLVPTINESLLAMQRSVRTALAPFCQDFAPFYEEKEWVPHCTLVLEMDPLELPRAYAVMLDQFQPFDTRLISLEIITCCPFRTELHADFSQS